MNPFKGEHRLEWGEFSYPLSLTLHDVAVVEAYFNASFHTLLHRYLAGKWQRVDVVWLLSHLLPEGTFCELMEQDAGLLQSPLFITGMKRLLLEGVLHLRPEPFDFAPHLRMAVVEWRMAPAHFWALTPREWRSLCMAGQGQMEALAQQLKTWQENTNAA